MITAPQLFAGIFEPNGDHNCFYCGGQCNTDYTVKKYVKDTFTNRDIVRRPASEYVCSGCICTLNERANINLANEEIRESQKTRLYTWVFSKSGRVAYTKAHLKLLTNIIINPPEPPFGIVLAVTGQKQLLFRSVLAWNRDRFPVMLEEEIITVSPAELLIKIQLASIVIAAIGKPSLGEMSSNHAIKYYDYYGNLDSFELWKKNMHSPISRLALFLSPSQKECQIVNEKRKPDTGIDAGRVSAQISLFD